MGALLDQYRKTSNQDANKIIQNEINKNKKKNEIAPYSKNTFTKGVGGEIAPVKTTKSNWTDNITPTATKTRTKEEAEELSEKYLSDKNLQMFAERLNNTHGKLDASDLWYDNFFKKSDKGVLSTIADTTTDVIGSIGSGITSSLEGLSDFTYRRAADVLDLVGADKKAEKLRKEADWNGAESFSNNVNHILSGDLSGSKELNNSFYDKVNQGSILGKTSKNILNGIGTTLTSASMGGAGLATLGMSAAGNAETEALQSGATANEARMYGILSGLTETASEMMFGGLSKVSKSLGFGKGLLDNGLSETLTKKINSKIVKGLVELGIDALEEGTEEVVSGLGSAVWKKLTYQKEEDLSKLLKDEHLLESFVTGALSAGIMQGTGSIVNNSININQKNSQLEQQKVTNNTNTLQQEETTQNMPKTFQEQLEKQADKRMQQDIQTREAIKNQIQEYMEDKGIEKPTKQDIDDSLVDILGYDNDLDVAEIKQMENLYYEVADEMYNINSKTNNLTTEEQKELESLTKLDNSIGLEGEYLKRFNELTNKSNGIVTKYKELNANPKYEDYKSIYNESKNLKNFNKDIVKQVESFIPENKQGRRTKEQWLDFAKQIGSQLDSKNVTSEELQKYALQSWFYEQPNAKDNLNRQGKGYVSFNADEWIKAVYQGANVGKEINIKNEKSINTNEIAPVKKPKILNPNEISKLTKEDANTTPNLPTKKRTKVGDGKSKYFENIKNKTNMLNDEQKLQILTNDDVKYYDKITNKDSLEEAKSRLDKNGRNETINWFNKSSESATATDVAEGWILLKQYADNNDTNGMVEVAKKMREIGTTAGQTVQAFNIMSRMTPEGMVAYAQSELSEAYDKMVKNKTKEWIESNRAKFDLKPSEVEFIMKTMQEVQNMEDGYDKKVKLAQIQKMMTDKLPPAKGAGIKSWMRISMLFNPKTQTRNVTGNALIAPVNYFGDIFSSYADKLISKKTGVRTTGNANVKAIIKGIKKGAYEATNDYKLGINTKNMEGNRFEIGEGKSFDNNKAIGRTLNRVDSMLSYMLDVGDRVFSEASFENSLQNQMILNNTTEITQDMIDIATQESLSRTWNDNNNYTKFVLDIRRMLNKIGTKNYGLGDILIPFAKTPANLTKAIVDYSPLGMVNTIIEGNNLRKSLQNGQFTPQMQHKFVQDLGKATAGTMLYIIGYALAKAGVSSGASDDDKDTKAFLKNSLGINSYSIKIGDKTFTYDWAQPLAAPLAITANIVKNEKSNNSLYDNILSSLDIAGSILLEQSFMQSLQTVLSNNDGVVSGLTEALYELPSRAIPTFSKQIVDLTDSTQRQTFEYDKPVETMINKIKSKIPGLSYDLAPSVDTMGNEIKKYGGNNNLFNVFLNPANVNSENISESAQEIYRVYQATGDKTILPKVADNYITKNGEKRILSSKEKAEFSKYAGNIIEEEIGNLMQNDDYLTMEETEQAKLIKNIIDFAYNKAKYDVLDIEVSDSYKKVNDYVDKGGDASYYYMNKEEVNYSYSQPEKYLVSQAVTSDYEKYTKYQDKIKNISATKDANGKSISGSRKQKVYSYVNSLNLSIPQKAILIKQQYPSEKNYDKQIVDYVNNLNISKNDKKTILKELGINVK